MLMIPNDSLILTLAVEFKQNKLHKASQKALITCANYTSSPKFSTIV